MIDMSRVKYVLDEVDVLIDDLDGVEHDDRDAVTNQSAGAARRQNATRSSKLQLLATRLELAAALVRIEYWAARGERDPLTAPFTDSV